MDMTLGISYQGKMTNWVRFETSFLGKYLAMWEMKKQKFRGNCTLRGFIICAFLQTLLGLQGMGWAGHVARITKWKMHLRLLLENLEVRDYLEDQCADGSIILNGLLGMYDWRKWIDFISLRIGNVAGCRKYGNKLSCYIKTGKFLKYISILFISFWRRALLHKFIISIIA